MLVSRFVKSFFLGAAFSVNILASGQRKNGRWSCRTKVFIIHSLPVDYQSPENEVLNATYPTNYYSPVTLIFWPTNLRHMFFSNNHAPWEAPGHGRVHGATSHPLSPKPGQGLTTNISPTNNMDVGPKIGLKLPPNHPFFSYGFFMCVEFIDGSLSYVPLSFVSISISYIYIMPTKYGIYQLFTWREIYTNLSRNCFIYTTSIHYIRHGRKPSHPDFNPTHIQSLLASLDINDSPFTSAFGRCKKTVIGGNWAVFIWALSHPCWFPP